MTPTSDQIRIGRMIHDTGAMHVTLGMGHTVHIRHPRNRHHTVCGLGPSPYFDASRGTIEPVPSDEYRPDSPGMMRRTDQPVTCHGCMGTRPAA